MVTVTRLQVIVIAHLGTLETNVNIPVLSSDGVINVEIAVIVVKETVIQSMVHVDVSLVMLGEIVKKPVDSVFGVIAVQVAVIVRMVNLVIQ